MEHPAPLARPLPWRTTALVAAAFATFEFILLLLVGLAFVRHSFSSGGSAAPTQASSARNEAPDRVKASVPAARLPREHTSVLVLNGNGRQGAAGEAADAVRSLRYVVAGTSNAPRTDFRRSIVMFRRGYRGEAVRLARDLRIRRVAPLDGLRPRDLQGAQVALVVGRS